MKTILLIAAALATTADASTTVAVLELGKGGSVRRTTSKNKETTVAGVASFWSRLHSGRNLQHAGMSVVPDLFKKPSSGLVLALIGADLKAMPTVSGLMDKEEGHVVGHMTLDGEFSTPLLQRTGVAAQYVDADSLSAKFMKKGLSAMSISVNDKNVAEVDSKIASLIESLHKQALDADTTIVLHLVVEEEEGAVRRPESRRLEDQQGEEGEDGENNNNGNGYYGYGYYNEYGEWVTPYKTMFQIQYFNIVLWTSIGLVVVLISTVVLMINMPLMADTLLFGESAKMTFE